VLLSMKAAQRNEAELSGVPPVMRRGSSSGSGSRRSSLFGSALFDAAAMSRLRRCRIIQTTMPSTSGWSARGQSGPEHTGFRLGKSVLSVQWRWWAETVTENPLRDNPTGSLAWACLGEVARVARSLRRPNAAVTRLEVVAAEDTTAVERDAKQGADRRERQFA